MEKDKAIRQYCTLEHYCYTCYKEDQQDLVKLYNGLCYLCDREQWNIIKINMTKENITRALELAPRGWRELLLEELKLR